MFAQTSNNNKKQEKSTASVIMGWVARQANSSKGNENVANNNDEQVTLSKLTYDMAARQIASSTRTQEEVVVTKVAVAITMGLPALSEEQTHHAMFAKQLYIAGEISYAHFIIKMRNLFPERMDNLSPELLAQVKQLSGDLVVN